MKEELSGLLSSKEIKSRIKAFLETKANDEVCALFMIDVDNFREIHDTLGEKTGEEVIRRVGQSIPSFFRTTDLVGRIGVDEFLVFLSGEITEDIVCEKASILCSELQFTEKTKENQTIQVTIGVGACVSSRRKPEFRKLYSRAEAALLEAKKRGERNFYILSDDSSLNKQLESELQVPPSIISLRTLLAYMEGGAALLELGSRIRILYANPGFFRMFGMDKSQMKLPCDLNKIGIFPDQEAEYERKLRSKVQKSGVIEHMHCVSTETGSIWRRVRAVRIAYPLSDAPVVLEMSTDISEFVESEKQLRESNERLRIAFGQTPHLLWELDLMSKTFTLFSMDAYSSETRLVLENFPDAFFEKGLVHPSSLKKFRGFAAELLDGKAEGYGNFIMRNMGNDQYGWISLSYRMIYDTEGVAVKAVGIREKMPDTSGMHFIPFPRRPLPEAIRHDLIVKLRVNLTTDEIEDLWVGGMDRTNQGQNSYMELIRSWSSSIFLRAEGSAFQREFERENLLTAFEQGKRWFSKECRWVDPGGNIRWMMYTVNLACNPDSRDIGMFCCFVDTQKRHEWERKLETGVVREPVSGFYDAQTMKELAECLIREKNGESCTLVLIRMQGADSLSAETDQAIGQIRRSFSVALSFALGTQCIVGEYREDVAAVFFPDSASRFEVKKRVEDAFSYIRMVMTEIPKLDAVRFIAGAVTEKLEDANYERMILRASYLCELWKTAAMDTVAFPDVEDEWIYMGLRKESEDSAFVLPGETERPLSAEEQKAAFYCVAEMLLSSDSAKASIESALRGIGMYYKAERVYILKRSKDKNTVSMSFEWLGQGKHSIQSVMTDVQMRRIPLLQRCVKERAPVFIRRQKEDIPEKAEFWNFTIFPVNLGDEDEQFICIENGREHSEETVLLEKLTPYIIQEEKRLWSDLHQIEEKKSADGKLLLEKMPNLRIYMETIHSMNSETYSSMGAVSLDVPNFSAISADKGYSYGSKLLSEIAEALDSVFGTAYQFRTWDAEFVVLYPDSILEAFIGRCGRLRAILERRCPGVFRLGYTWSEGIFFGENLVREAQSIMRSETIKTGTNERNVFLNNLGTVPKTSIEKRSFIAYFQPKIDMRDGSLAGAEALVREIEEDGTLIPPATFIEALENNGRIRELDLYMLEQVLWQLSEWKSQGMPPIRVSVNISRHTLLDPNALASILAIQSHYPDIPTDRISLEITETAGDIEKTTLSSIIDRFREFGIRFELDDFGSHYSNISIFSNINFDTIKLDKSLISELPDNEISQILVKDIVNICRDFGMSCVAEGVENSWQKEALLKAGCIYGQGYYYSRPLSPAKFEEQYLREPQKKHEKGD